MSKEDDIESEIRIINYVWKNQVMLVTGHYEFEIQLSKKYSSSGKLIMQKIIYRRFSDLEILYSGLIKYNPGSLIPNIPEKSFWCNLSFSNNIPMINKRKQKIERYLSYINKHNYLSKNPIYLLFISDDFDKYKNELNSNITVGDIIQKKFKEYIYPNILPSYLKKLAGSSNSQITDLSEENIKNEKNRIIKILKSVEMTQKSINDFNNLYNKRLNYIKNIIDITKNLQNSNFKVEIKEVNNEDFVVMKDNLGKNIELYKNLYEKLKYFCEEIDELNESFINYYNFIKALLDIFERKKQLEFDLQKEKNEEFMQNIKKIEYMETSLNNLNIQMKDEIINFQLSLEKLYFIYLDNFFKIKLQLEKDVKFIFSGEGFNVIKKHTNEIIESHFDNQ